MADSKASALAELVGTPADATIFYVGDGGVPKKLTYGTLKLAFGAFSADADTLITPVTAISLDQATGDEAALTLDYTINKATSGNVSGIRIDGTETSVPGDHYALEIVTGQVLLPQFNFAASPTLAFGDGDSGFYESSDDVIACSIQGTSAWVLTSTFMGSNGFSGAGGGIVNELGSATNPTLIPRGDDADTGIGSATLNQLSLIAGGVEQARFQTTGNHLIYSLLDAATGNEEALTLSYNTNKATSGDDAGLVINKVDVASPGTSLLTDWRVGGVSQAFVSDVGGINVDAAGAFSPTSGFMFGDGDTVLYEFSDDIVIFQGGGAARFVWSADDFAGAADTSALLKNETASATNPVFVIKGDDDTGIGSAAADQLSLITGGVEGLRISETGGVTQVEINQGTNDAPFFDFQATADADATSAISTLTTSGAVTHHIQIEINGTTAWIPCSTTDPT
jgi:hypothetical protein